MNGDAPDRYPPSPFDITSMGFMPTREHGEDFGYRVEFEIEPSTTDTLRVGSEFHGQTLDDRWPGAPVGMMFDYVNLNHARRNQLGTFVEWQKSLSRPWRLLAGVRNDTIWMNTGPVQGYDGVDPAAAAFNSGSRRASDMNIDATLLVRYQPDGAQSYDLGIARKNRSPNLYERYAWGQNTMGMVSWFGDGNGYTGNPALRPETAYTLSAVGSWQDPTAMRWRIKVTPYFTRIENYIGVESICDPGCSGSPDAQLLFSNHEARLYGIDSTANYRLLSDTVFGSLGLIASAGVVHGEDLTAHTGLYRMMPLNGTLGVEHERKGWQSRLELRLVTAKREIDPARLEPETGGYAVVTLRTAYSWQQLRFDAAITNLLDRQYADPLSGRWQSGLYHPQFAGVIPPLPGMGRSFDLGVTISLR
jgi:iron complex outermembrane receptor protein